ncbi:ribosome maturation factor RimP [Xylanimonas ulmi]|uniref:Ribosome maturation factor RimP n=1 Tax=Xylanimonas ulmi TaxID=228973 RepID=A0A4V2EY12_9MICO|nr:ribosome maturation factor RimP [Xylanibacterium ulmi]RZS61380.1 ribosome maturation factor RimP [Xylanibacterium ulmi]
MAGPRNERTSGGSATADAVRRVVAPAVDAQGLWLEAVTTTRAGSRSVVRVTVDLPQDEIGSLGSDALGDVSRAISAALDADDVVPGVYVLEVSTPGTSRPLTELRHFRRARTRLVTLTLTDGGEVVGRLEDVVEADGGPVLVLDDGARVPLEAVRRGRVEVELKRLDDEADADLADDTDDPDDHADDAGTNRTENLGASGAVEG